MSLVFHDCDDFDLVKNNLDFITIEAYLGLYLCKYNYNLSDPYVIQTVFNLTMNDVWYFAPKPHMEKPLGFMIICLVLTPPLYQNPLEDWTVKVRTLT